MGNSLSTIKEKVGNNLNNININTSNNNFHYFMCAFIVIVITVVLIVRSLYINNLESSEVANMNNLYSQTNENIQSIDDTYNQRFGDYYINTAYNACSGGNYKNDFVSPQVLVSIISQGVRCLDFAIYNENSNPVVATSTSESNFVKETYDSVPFAEVMGIINSKAFDDTANNKYDPIILHLRIKSNDIELYDNIAKIFNNYSGRMLGNSDSFLDHGQNFAETPLIQLKGKIIIIVDGSNRTFEQSKSFLEYVNLASNYSNYMYCLRYYDVKNIYDPNEFTEHNKTYMTLVLTDIGNSPENPAAQLTREYGCQMVAMRYQLSDERLQENINFFNENMHAFVLKPESLRAIKNKIVIVDGKNAKPNSEASRLADLAKGEVTILTQNPELSYKTKEVTNKLFNFKY